MAAWIAGDRRWSPDLPHILLGLLCLAVLIAYAYGVASVTEFKTDAVRRWLEGKLGLGASRARVEAVAGSSKIAS
jgi:hypothetical protein